MSRGRLHNAVLRDKSIGFEKEEASVRHRICGVRGAAFHAEADTALCGRTETAGCNESFRCKGSGNVLHITTRRLYCSSSDERPQSRWEVPPADIHRRTKQYMGGQRRQHDHQKYRFGIYGGWSFLCRFSTPKRKQNQQIILLQPEGKTLLNKLLVKYPPEVDASQLQKILKAHWKVFLTEKPSLELCKSLIMLRDYNISGRINIMDIPVLMQMLQFWRVHTQ